MPDITLHHYIRGYGTIVCEDGHAHQVRLTDISVEQIVFITQSNLKPGMTCLFDAQIVLATKTPTHIHCRGKITHNSYCYRENGFRITFKFSGLEPDLKKVIGLYVDWQHHPFIKDKL